MPPASTSRSPAPAAPLVLIYNHFPGMPGDVSGLPEADRRCFTWDTTLLNQADAVVFHIPNLGAVNGLRKRAGQLWVLWSMESTVNYPCMTDPAFLKWFDLKMTYEREADIWVPYLPDRQAWDEAMSRPGPTKSERAHGVLFQSSGLDRSGRMAFASELMQHVRIDSYGKDLNNRQLLEIDRWRPTKVATIARYKFCLALENSVAKDYVTEKFFDPLLVGTIPVYLGALNIDDFAPGDGAYINVRDFSSPAALAAYLQFLDANDDVYNRLFDWRSRPLRPAFERDLARIEPAFAKLLRIVRSRSQQPGHEAGDVDVKRRRRSDQGQTVDPR